MISFIKNKSNALRSKDRKKLMASVFVGTNFYSINKDRILVLRVIAKKLWCFLKNQENCLAKQILSCIIKIS